MGDITNSIISGLIVVALSKGVDKASKSDLLNKVPTIAKDYFALWQKNNATIVGARVKRILEERGYNDETNFRVPSTKFAFGFVQGASVEDQTELQELWAKLLANAFDPNFKEDIPTSFISIIKDLSPMDVRVINELQAQIKKKPKYAFGDGWPNIDYITEFAKELKIDPNTIRISFENLFRLRIVDNKKMVNVLAAPHPNMHGEKQKNESAISNRYPYFTSLGESFIKACFDDAGNNKADSSE